MKFFHAAGSPLRSAGGRAEISLSRCCLETTTTQLNAYTGRVLRYAISGGDVELSGTGPHTDRLVRRSAELARDGVDFLLIREKQLLGAELMELATRIVDAVRGSGMRVIVAGPIQIVLAAGADGVHVGANATAWESIRAMFPLAWVSVSCHSLSEVTATRQARADAILFAPVFGKTIGGDEVVDGVGLEALREACAAAGDLPVFALGGVTGANADECVRAGAAGVAGIRMFFGA